ncbi:MAG TPA: hypothetical protein VFT42_10555, partial [Solirubrobacteraceae bacterium]|nr:hypothetical protein [Solirubrobacteraceae bacterium]
MRRQKEVVEQCAAVEGEARGALLWALQLAELPPYDEPFAPEALATGLAGAQLRDAAELDRARQSARLWHWRARTADLADEGAPDLPERFASLDQAVAAAAVRGHERGLLPQPLRGDFRAYGKIYRHLGADERAEAHAIAAERHHALAWLCG